MNKFSVVCVYYRYYRFSRDFLYLNTTYDERTENILSILM